MEDSFLEGYIGNKYSIETKTIESEKQCCWNTLEVNVFKTENGKKEAIGSYKRNYPNVYRTFFPFMQDGKEYALYSSDYTSTRIMELPNCKDLGGEERDGLGFCPVEFYVPIFRKVTIKKDDMVLYLNQEACLDEKESSDKYILHPIQYHKFGFVAGCVWGDDSSWKIQYLDLSEASKGILKRDDRFGYIELPERMKLPQAVGMRDWEPSFSRIKIAHETWFELNEVKKDGN